MAVWLKQGRSVEASKADDARVRATVETMLAAIETEGMAAVRRYSRELDNWDRADFRLTRDEIGAAYAALPESTIDDIRFAQAQIHLDVDDKVQALERYALRAEQGGSAEETYVSLYRAAQLKAELGADPDDVVATYLKAFGQ